MKMLVSLSLIAALLLCSPAIAKRKLGKLATDKPAELKFAKLGTIRLFTSGNADPIKDDFGQGAKYYRAFHGQSDVKLWSLVNLEDCSAGEYQIEWEKLPVPVAPHGDYVDVRIAFGDRSNVQYIMRYGAGVHQMLKTRGTVIEKVLSTGENTLVFEMPRDDDLFIDFIRTIGVRTQQGRHPKHWLSPKARTKRFVIVPTERDCYVEEPIPSDDDSGMRMRIDCRHDAGKPSFRDAIVYFETID